MGHIVIVYFGLKSGKEYVARMTAQLPEKNWSFISFEYVTSNRTIRIAEVTLIDTFEEMNTLE